MGKKIKKLSSEEHLEMIRKHLLKLKIDKKRKRGFYSPKNTMKRKMRGYKIFQCKPCGVVACTAIAPTCEYCGKKMSYLFCPSPPRAKK